MDSHVVIYTIKAFNLIFGDDLLLGYLVTSFYLLNKSEVFVLNITFLKDNWRHFMLVGKFCCLGLLTLFGGLFLGCNIGSPFSMVIGVEVVDSDSVI